MRSEVQYWIELIIKHILIDKIKYYFVTNSVTNFVTIRKKEGV